MLAWWLAAVLLQHLREQAETQVKAGIAGQRSRLAVIVNSI
jgi:hypothetical protein